jgi:hypothetical protein
MVIQYQSKKVRPGGRYFMRSILPRKAWLRWGAGLLLLLGMASALSGQTETPPTETPAERRESLGDAPSIGLPSRYSINPTRLASGLTEQAEGELKERPQKLTVFGYYRLFLYGRNMTTPYPNLAPFERTYSVGDGYREPMMSLNLLARPNGRSAFGTELFFFTPYFGTGTEDNVFTLNLGLNFYGNFRTEIGKFGIRAGGIHWYNLSPFTVGVYQILDRFSIFDRTPWEGVTNTLKYDNYFETGSVNVGDQRWNYQAFQGLIIDGAKLPGDLNFDLFWGKMQPNGGLPNAASDPTVTIQNPLQAGNVPTYQGFAGDRRTLSSFITGGRLGRTFRGGNTVNYNLLYSQTALDSITRANWNFQVHSLSLDWTVSDINITGELAMGNFNGPQTSTDWGEALMLRVKVPREKTFLPLDLQLYQISKNFFNPNGEINTSANPEINENFPVEIAAGQGSVGGLLTQVNQLAHNRRGVNLNTGWENGPLKLNFGWGLAAEIDTITTELSYVHRINGLALSRIYNPFPANAVRATTFGPYNRQFAFFRGVFERVRTTDLNPATAEALTRKFYNVVDLQAKFRTKVLDRNLYLFYLGNLNSASLAAKAWPTLDDESYLFVQYHELDIYYEIVPRFLLTGYLGLERAQGGRLTEWGENLLPRDQTGIGIGAGFDWTLSDATGLYFRYRYMEFEDRNFELDKYAGNEITIELKTFF